MLFPLQLTSDIEEIVEKVVQTGEPQEIRDMENGTCGDPYIWLTADWYFEDNSWVVQVEFRYSDTGRGAFGCPVPETRMTVEEYQKYRNDL